MSVAAVHALIEKLARTKTWTSDSPYASHTGMDTADWKEILTLAKEVVDGN